MTGGQVSKNLDWKHCTATPRVVTLCGSTRFMDQFFKSGWAETLAGRIVFSVGVVIDDGEASAQLPNDHLGEHFGVKDLLDEVHFRKIDLSDEILVLNLDGYVGKSTQREMAYAMAQGKMVRFLEPEAGDDMLAARYADLKIQIDAFTEGRIAPLCVECDDAGEVFDVVPTPDGPSEVHGPCPKCDPTGGARQGETL